MAQCVVKDVIAHPSVTQGGGLTLECDDGELSVMRNVFAVSSLLIADLVGNGCSLVKVCACIPIPWKQVVTAVLCARVCPLWSLQVSGSTKEEWLLVISQLYPIVPRPELSLQQLQQVLPVVHKFQLAARELMGGEFTLSPDMVLGTKAMEVKWLESHEQSPSCLLLCLQYNFPELLQYVSGRLVTELPTCWSLVPTAPGYVIKWLVTAEQLQLDALKEAALGGIKKQCPYQFKRRMAAKVLDADLLNLSPGLMLEALRVSMNGLPDAPPHGMVQCVVKDVIAHPSVAQGGGLTLDCDDGELSVLRDVFAVSSPLMADLLSTGCTLVKVSGSTKEEWLLVISQLYPIIPHPELSLPQLQQVLPVVHKYNFLELLQYVNGRLVTELPSCWSLNPSAPGYIIKWLVMAEQLQLDALKQAALEGLKKQPPNQIKGQMAAKVLDADLLCFHLMHGSQRQGGHGHSTAPQPGVANQPKKTWSALRSTHGAHSELCCWLELPALAANGRGHPGLGYKWVCLSKTAPSRPSNSDSLMLNSVPQSLAWSLCQLVPVHCRHATSTP
ncbi:hypothetical protein QJQ45_030090 [Haematococcus lacustris]|nr:hypothetical protein QJQ45_030090 [Haematococcus lacustris]